MNSNRHTAFYVAYLKSTVWANFRQQVIEAAGNRCVRCRDLAFLQVHHKHYLTLGRESPNDVEALCPSCHRFADEVRQDETWRRRVDGFARKKYGDNWRHQHDFRDVADEFDVWLERKTAA